jgi:hypothetical protein
MIMRLGTRIATLLFALLACSGERKADESAADAARTPDNLPPAMSFDVQLPQPERLVSGDSAHLSSSLDMALDSQGRIWIADARNKRVVVFDSEGKLVRTIGREGDGPGEFRLPVRIAINDTLVRVYDPMHHAIQDYRPDGTYLMKYESAGATMGSALSADGYLVNSMIGLDSTLATIRPLDNAVPTRLGPLVVPPSVQNNKFPFELSDAIKAEAKNGRIATITRNMVKPVIGNRGTVWLLLESDHEVRKYSSDGKLLWQRPLNVPEADAAIKAFIRKTAAMKPNEPGFAPVTMDAAREIGGMLWILIHGEAGQPTVFYLLDTATGKVQGRLSVTTPAPAHGFNVDPARKRMYLIIPDDADIWSVDLSSATKLSWD